MRKRTDNDNYGDDDDGDLGGRRRQNNNARSRSIINDDRSHSNEDRDDDDDDGAVGGGQLVSQSELFDRLQRALPLDNVVQAIGYGSGVFSQQQSKQQSKDKETGDRRRRNYSRRSDDEDDDNNNETSSDLYDDNKHSDDSPLIDLIVVVKDATEFHRLNFIQNPTHYSTALLWPRKRPPRTTRTLHGRDGPLKNADDDDDDYSAAASAATVVARRAAWIQRHSVPSFLSSLASNPGAYYVVDNNLHRIKYGVIHQHDLLDDVTNWKYLYGAGRMHKPTVTVYNTQESAPIQEAQRLYNVPAALSTALLLLSGTSFGDGTAATTMTTSCNERNVYEAIAGLSYSGDFRMTIGAEDPRKIQNLVTGPGSLQRFRQLYKDAASNLEQQGLLSIQSTMSSSPSNSALAWTWNTSEGAVRALAESLSPRFKQVVLDLPSTTADSAATRRLLLQRQLQRTVAPAARYQSLKGLVTAGSVQTSIQYALRKLRKGRGR